jgi:hypothetical protein
LAEKQQQFEIAASILPMEIRGTAGGAVTVKWLISLLGSVLPTFPEAFSEKIA